MSDETRPDIYIIESLEKKPKQILEGEILSSHLKLNGKKGTYSYVETKKELIGAIDRFGMAGYRYLHLSCHGGNKGKSVELVKDSIAFADFADILNPYLYNRRLFVSGCSLANEHLAKAIMPGSKCYSIVGPRDDILFSTAAVMWPALYHIMFQADESQMKYATLKVKVRAVADLFGVRLNYIRADEKSPHRYTIVALEPSG